MTNEDDADHEFDLDVMRVELQFLETMSNMSRKAQNLCDVATVLDYDDAAGLQQFYDSLNMLKLGLDSLINGFHSLASARGTELRNSD